MATELRFLFAADLDGTLLPNTRLPAPPDCVAATHALLQRLHNEGIPTAYVSGRHLALAQAGCATYNLPAPTHWVCNVGSQVFASDGQVDDGYEALLGPPLDAETAETLPAVYAGLTWQEDEKQAPHKLSFYYPAEMEPGVRQRLATDCARLFPNTRLVYSIEEASGRALIDLLPAMAGKSGALKYLARHHRLGVDQLYFAGDSGNDLDALTCGLMGTLVGNAPLDVRSEARRLQQQAPDARVYLANALYGLGVLEGLHHYRLVAPTP
ncbi:MAG: HAD-IIB family hydrolase [Pseudomonadota bacterium]|nr:HAD-IIB family hydrolase [Pseudomonadota bacterium]